jgi:large subunit ribosomal protein L22
MAKHKYNYQKELPEKKTARVHKTNLRISTKYATEFSNYFKGKNVNKAIKILIDIQEKKDHLPLKKYTLKVGHKKGQAKRGTPTGRYPIKASKVIQGMLEEVKANAESKDLDTDKLIIIHMFATKGVTRTKLQPLGRPRRRESKSTNVEVIVLEE